MMAVQDIVVEQGLWGSLMFPNGSLTRWRVADRSRVGAGQVVAEVAVEDSRHEIVAPAGGTLIQVVCAGDLLQPGTVIGRIEPG